MVASVPEVVTEADAVDVKNSPAPLEGSRSMVERPEKAKTAA
jgi:hypothetical protein